MNNIRYSNREIKQKLDNYFRKEVFYRDLLYKIIKKFSILKPIIKEVAFDYDALNFEIVDKNSVIYNIKIDLFSDLISIRQNNKNFYKIYRVIDSDLFLVRKDYFKQNKILERVFRNDNILEYHFNNGFLNCQIYGVLNIDQTLNDDVFAKELLEIKEDISDISSLYHKISKLVGFEKISIINHIQDYEEKIVVALDVLKEYKRRIIKGEEIEYLDYHDGKIFITREEKENLELEEMKKLIK